MATPDRNVREHRKALSNARTKGVAIEALEPAPMTYTHAGPCALCGTVLSKYNPRDRCWSCDEPEYPL